MLSIGLQSFVSAADIQWLDFEVDKDEHLTDNSDKVWTVTFSQTTHNDSVKDANVYVKKKTGELVKTEADVKGNTILVKPMQSYEVGKSYYLYIGPGIVSESGKGQAANIRFEFTIVEKDSNSGQPKTVQSVMDVSIQIDGKTYIAAQHLEGLLKTSNNDALFGAEINYTSQENVITEILDLRLVNSGKEMMIQTAYWMVATPQLPALFP